MDIPASLFSQKNSLSIRIWHWITFLFITASLVCVLFASTIFTTRGNISMVQDQLQHKGMTVSPEQARAVTHEYNDKLWMLHKYFGYGLCLLLLCRIIIELALTGEEKLGHKIKSAIGLSQRHSIYQDKNHYLMVKFGYLFFYLVLLILVITGLGLAYEDVPYLKSIHRQLIQVHGAVQYLMYFYILVHIVGVIRADVSHNNGIVSSMINGNPQK